MLRCVAQGWSEVTNAEPGQRALHAVHKPGAFLDQALALCRLASSSASVGTRTMLQWPHSPAATPGTRA